MDLRSLPATAKQELLSSMFRGLSSVRNDNGFRAQIANAFLNTSVGDGTERRFVEPAAAQGETLEESYSALFDRIVTNGEHTLYTYRPRPGQPEMAPFEPNRVYDSVNQEDPRHNHSGDGKLIDFTLTMVMPDGGGVSVAEIPFDLEHSHILVHDGV